VLFAGGVFDGGVHILGRFRFDSGGIAYGNLPQSSSLCNRLFAFFFIRFHKSQAILCVLKTVILVLYFVNKKTRLTVMSAGFLPLTRGAIFFFPTF